MYEFFNLLGDFYRAIFGSLNNAVFDVNGRSITLGSILVVCVIIGLVVSVFWRGARA